MAVSLRIWGNAKSPGPDASPGTAHAVPPGPRTFLSVISRACWKPSSAPNTPLKSGSWSQSGRFDTNSVTVPPGPVAAIPPRSGTRGAPAPAPRGVDDDAAALRRSAERLEQAAERLEGALARRA